MKQHHLTNTPTWNSWRAMIKRCSQPSTRSYKLYGGRGIKVCASWLEFKNFLSDMGERPSRSYSLERINNDGNYEPTNCKWATPTEQARNRVNNTVIELDGNAGCLSKMAELHGISRFTASSRLSMGWSVEDALTKPINRRLTDEEANEIRALGGSLTQAEIAKRFGVNPSTVGRILNRVSH